MCVCMCIHVYGCELTIGIYVSMLIYVCVLAQSAGAVEYTDCTSAEG